MTIAQTMNPRSRAHAQTLGRDLYRLRDSTTGDLLHLSGRGTTKTTTWAWAGHRHQAERLKRRAQERGEAWPFTLVDRGMLEPVMTTAERLD